MDMFTFIENCDKHKKSVIKITIDNVDDPHVWIPIKWTKIMVFTNCFKGKLIVNPPEETDTEELHITNYDRHHLCPTFIRINWEKFPKLKILNIYCWSIDRSNLNNCNILKKITIDTVISEDFKI